MRLKALSVKHILLDCPAFNVCRKLFYELNSLKELFSIILTDFFVCIFMFM